MGMSVSTLRWVAPTSWVIDVAAQLYGMTSTPSMLDIHNANPSFFSPQPYFIAGFFTPQQVVQVAWLYRLLTLPKNSPELAVQADYAPVYALGNLCIATWMLLWNNSNLVGSNVAVTINSVAQLAYLAGAVGHLGRMNTRSWSSILTHVNVKTFAGIGVLDLLHNTSAAFAVNGHAGTMVKVLTGVGFLGASAVSDWIFGGCLVYDLVALSVGQAERDPGWSKLLAAFAVGSAAIVGVKNWASPPYDSKPVDYDGLAYGDAGDIA